MSGDGDAGIDIYSDGGRNMKGHKMLVSMSQTDIQMYCFCRKRGSHLRTRIRQAPTINTQTDAGNAKRIRSRAWPKWHRMCRELDTVGVVDHHKVSCESNMTYHRQLSA